MDINNSKVSKANSAMTPKKIRTMQSIVDAVGRVIEKLGYPGLTIMNIEIEAKQHRKLIYLYFGNLDNLVETYIRQKDFWGFATKEFIEQLENETLNFGRADVVKLLQDQLSTMLEDKILQRIIHWELGESNEMLRKVADRREAIGEQLFGVIEPDFMGKGVDLRAIMALLIGGIYYLSIHGTTNGSLFCGIDINQPEGKERIASTLDTLIEWAYEHARERK